MVAFATKTIEFAFPTNIASLAAATRRDFSAITVQIPESSVAFLSVEVQITVADHVTSAASMTSHLIGIKLGAVAFSDSTVTATLTHSGEAQSYQFSRDVTSYFLTNWTGTSMTCQVGVQFGGVATNNHCAKLIITYLYDTASTSQIKTIRIPLESTHDLLDTVSSTILDTLPNTIDNLLPEASPSIDQMFIELWGNEATASTGDFTAHVAWGTAGVPGTVFDWWHSESALSSSRWAHGIAVGTSSEEPTEEIFAWLSTTSDRITQAGGWLVITYRYTPGSSTVIWNSLLLPVTEGAQHAGGTNTNEKFVEGTQLQIQEPYIGDAIVMQPSAFCAFLWCYLDTTISCNVGSQSTPTAYAITSGALTCGQSSFVHRIDENGQNGVAALTLDRGLNTIVVRTMANRGADGTGLSGFIVLNYTSGKSAAGVGAHNRTISQILIETGNVLGGSMDADDNNVGASIADVNYWLNSVLLAGKIVHFPAIAGGVEVKCMRQSGEAEAEGWERLGGMGGRMETENAFQTPWLGSDTRRHWRRRNTDPQPSERLDIEVARDWRLGSSALLFAASMTAWVTYHAITKTVSGQTFNYDSTGVGIPVMAFDANGKLLTTGTTTTAGAFSLTVFDDTVQVFVTAREDDENVGRSKNATPV